MSRNSLSYVKDEINYHRNEARGSNALDTAAGWAYEGPVLTLELLWWIATRIIGIPLVLAKRAWRGLRYMGSGG